MAANRQEGLVSGDQLLQLLAEWNRNWNSVLDCVIQTLTEHIDALDDIWINRCFAVSGANGIHKSSVGPLAPDVGNGLFAEKVKLNLLRSHLIDDEPRRDVAEVLAHLSSTLSPKPPKKPTK